MHDTTQDKLQNSALSTLQLILRKMYTLFIKEKFSIHTINQTEQKQY